MRSEEDEEIQQKDDEERNVFEQLLAHKDTVHKVVVRVPYIDDPLIIHYMPLKAGEDMRENIIPEDFADLTPKEKVDLLLGITEEKVWKMIEKANKNPETPKKYVITRETWLDIKENYPDVFDQITGTISGRAMDAFQTFFGGQQTQG